MKGTLVATVRITGSTPKNIHKKEWLGTPAFANGRIERALDLPEIIYQRIEESIAKGAIEGLVATDDGWRIDWFLDR
jgi:hypothetical protein